MTETNTVNNNNFNDYFKKDIINENLRKKYELQKAAEKFNISIIIKYMMNIIFRR